jgi:hypothetical protein
MLRAHQPLDSISRNRSRVCGEIRLKLGEIDRAEEISGNSIGLARTMGAKAWELRATMSLARLLRDTNHCDEPCAMLAEILKSIVGSPRASTLPI